MSAVLDTSGPAAPPRANGELVFAEPWESRTFGMAMALHAGGVFEWEDFRQELIAAIAAWETEHRPGAEYSYYRCWLEALERVVSARGLVDADVLQRRAAELAGHEH